MNLEILARWFLHNVYPPMVYGVILVIVWIVSALVSRSVTIQHFKNYHVDQVAFEKLANIRQQYKRIDLENQDLIKQNEKYKRIIRAVYGALDSDRY